MLKMKSKILFKTLFILLLFPLILAADPCDDYKLEKQKTIKKSFNVSDNTTLNIDNSFGNLSFITWNENKIDFDISVKVSGNKLENIEEQLNQINIEFKTKNNWVSATTIIEQIKNNWWSWNDKNNLKIEVNYIVKMPITNNLEVKNKFGSITLDKLEGSSKIRCDHGKITSKGLLSNNNYLKMNHTRGNYFDFIKNATLSLTHSSINIDKAENLYLYTQHSVSRIEYAENVDYNAQHGTIEISNTNTLKGNSQHLTAIIGNLYNNAQIYSQHGSLKINKIATNAKNIDINAQFTPITIGYDPDFKFNFEVEQQFGSIRNINNFSITSKNTSNTSNKYSGYNGSNNSGNYVKVDCQHSSLSFNEQ